MKWLGILAAGALFALFGLLQRGTRRRACGTDREREAAAAAGGCASCGHPCPEAHDARN